MRGLTERAEVLRARHAQLLADTEAEQHASALPDVETIAAVHNELVLVSKCGPLELRKAVAQAFVHELRVERKDLILPTFRVLPGLPAPPKPGKTRFVQ